jgi:hypothetical protein
MVLSKPNSSVLLYNFYLNILLVSVLQIEKLEKEQGVMSESAGAVGVLQTMPLPEGMAPTSAELIASLNEHLVIALQARQIIFTSSTVFFDL